jgi:hypothetical protein
MQDEERLVATEGVMAVMEYVEDVELVKDLPRLDQFRLACSKVTLQKLQMHPNKMQDRHQNQTASLNSAVMPLFSPQVPPFNPINEYSVEAMHRLPVAVVGVVDRHRQLLTSRLASTKTSIECAMNVQFVPVK